MNAHENAYTARCPDCKELVAYIPDDLSDQDTVRAWKKEYEAAGYVVEHHTQGYVRARFSSRGCTCDKGAA